MLYARVVRQVGGKFHIGDAGVRKHLCHLSFNVIGISKCDAHHAGAENLTVRRPGGIVAGFQGKLFADPGHAGVGRGVSFPETAQSKCTGSHLRGGDIFLPFQRDAGAKLRRDAETLQGQSVERDLVFGFRHPPGFRPGKTVFGILVAGVADLHLPPGQIRILCVAEDDGIPGACHQRVCGDLLDLFIGNALRGGMRGGSRLAQIHFRHISSQTLSQRKQGGKHHRRQNDGEDGDQIPPPVRFKTAPGQCL